MCADDFTEIRIDDNLDKENEMTEKQRETTGKPKSPNYFMIGMCKVLNNIFIFIFFPLLLIVLFCKWIGGDPDVAKTFENMKNPSIAIFLAMFIWIFCFIFCYGVVSIVFGN